VSSFEALETIAIAWGIPQDKWIPGRKTDEDQLQHNDFNGRKQRAGLSFSGSGLSGKIPDLKITAKPCQAVTLATNDAFTSISPGEKVLYKLSGLSAE